MKKIVFLVSAFLFFFVFSEDVFASTTNYYYFTNFTDSVGTQYPYDSGSQSYYRTLTYTSGSANSPYIYLNGNQGFSVPKNASKIIFQMFITGLNSSSEFNVNGSIYLPGDEEGKQGFTTVYYSNGSLNQKVITLGAQISTDNGIGLCDLSSTSLDGFATATCSIPAPATKINYIIAKIYHSDATVIRFGVTPNINVEIDASTQSIIENQNENTQKVIDNANQNSKNEVNATNKNTEAVNNMNSTISNSNVDIDDSFFSGFDNETHGLTSIITAPLQLIGSITSSTCSPLALPMPFVEQTAYLPCMGEIYQQWFGDFFKLYQTITFGIVSYWVCVQIYAMVKGFKDPDSDRIEVLDL